MHGQGRVPECAVCPVLLSHTRPGSEGDSVGASSTLRLSIVTSAEDADNDNGLVFKLLMSAIVCVI